MAGLLAGRATEDSKSRRKDFLGVGFFVNPIPVAAVVLLAINDHYLKGHFNNWWTGKLSDFAGLFFFPLFLCALWVIALSWKTGIQFWLTKKNLIFSILITDAVFVLVKLVPYAATLYEETLGKVGFPSRVTPDPTDLIALSVNVLTYLYGRKFWKPNGAE